jgi:hypothetical protein
MSHVGVIFTELLSIFPAMGVDLSLFSNTRKNSMQFRWVLFFALLCLTIFPTSVKAQFQPPTPDELKMTVDPKAPGADAVYLDIEEIANDPIHYQSIYARIKVLKEKGKDLATVEVPYLRHDQKITDIKARTIHPDGTIIPLEGKPDDLLISKNKDREIGRRVFNLPSVEVGSILEYRYEIRYDDNHYSSPLWDIQRPYFVHKGHYQFTPFKAFMPTGTPGTETMMYLVDGKGRTVNSLIWWANLPPGVKMKTDMGGHYTVDVTDVPAAPDEEWMPPTESYLYRLFFYYKYSSDAQKFWDDEAKDWSKDVDRFAEPSKGIRAAVAGLIAPTDNEEAKARKLYAAVQALENTDYTRTKSASELKQLNIKIAKHAEDTWKQKSGSSEDIAMLYIAMARAAGLQAYAVKVTNRGRALFDVSYMDADQLDDTLVLVGLDGKGMLIDPGEKMCPFGQMNWRHSDAGGLRQGSAGAGTVLTPTQLFKGNVTMRSGDITIGAHGEAEGSIRIIMTGQEALRWRQEALRNDESELKKQFDRSLESTLPDGVEGHIDHFLGLNEADEALMAIVKVKGTLGTATSKRLLLPEFFFEARERAPFVSEEKRLISVDMHYGEQVSDEITYHLPAGMTVEGAPADANIPWIGHAAYGSKIKSEPGQITVVRTLARAFTFAKPDEYQDLRGFYQKIATADQQQLVLTMAQPAAKGN